MIRKMQIKPLIEPTRLIMKAGVRNYEWHEIFPEGLLFYFNFLFSFVVCIVAHQITFCFLFLVVKSNAAAIVAVWAPIMVVSSQ